MNDLFSKFFSVNGVNLNMKSDRRGGESEKEVNKVGNFKNITH